MTCDKYLSASILLASMMAAGTAAATDIYRWVDANGVTHFSDTPPEETEHVQTLHVNAPNRPDYDPVADPYSIANQAQRINEKWQELAEQKAKRAERRRERVQYAARFASQRYDGWRYSHWPGYYAPVRPVRPLPNPFRTIRRQASALEALSLTGARPHSINSGAHAARIDNSNAFLQAVTKAQPRPLPRRN